MPETGKTRSGKPLQVEQILPKKRTREDTISKDEEDYVIKIDEAVIIKEEFTAQVVIRSEVDEKKRDQEEDDDEEID